MKLFKLKGKIILAPMEGVTNIPFKVLCKKYGSSLAYTSQLSAVAINRKSERILKQARSVSEERPVGLQLFGRNPEVLLKAAKKFEKNFDLIDLNFGCPSNKIVKQGYGSALLKEKDRIFDIVNIVSEGLKKPLTVKIRSGFKKVEALELVKVIERAGASAITIHARTQKQGYSGKADWELIKKVKSKVGIPVIGNGDVIDEESAERMLKETGCDYVMVGRGAMKNPFLFKRINHYLKTGKKLKQKDKLELFKEYYELCKKYKMVELKNLKVILSYFTQGLGGSKKIRERINKVKSVNELLKINNKFNKFII
ncbi:MAG: tRNA dihydrouridine synthase DusB [Nanoarchaeota archaeon]|jgi:nifR3 family TIM-barrel protein|nr:tRNA dihydrouridine synthase DusB [Nanoarchaeota archaeon]|tara:strand:+ start:25847 stop:26782 length:936 start_codon:yes stop_codon:yes gene_type:complete